MTEPEPRSLAIVLTPDATIPEPFDGWMGVRTDDRGELAFKVLVRPDLPEVAMGTVADWVIARIARVLVPDGSEPDLWDVGSDGIRSAWHWPDTLPEWPDLLLD